MKIVLNPTGNKNKEFIAYGDVKPGQCFVDKNDLCDENPAVWIKTTKIIEGHTYCALLNTETEYWEDGRLGYYHDDREVALVNMLCIATYDHEEQEGDKEDGKLYF